MRRGCWIVVAACSGSSAPLGDDAPQTPVCTNPHDEDGDGVVDACDNCPTWANPDQADTTEESAMQFADGVGNACDVRPGRAGDKQAAFYPFASPDEASAFTGTGWQIDSDRAIGNSALWASRAHYQGDGIIAQIRIATLTWNAVGDAVYVAVDGDGASSGSRCGLVHGDTGDAVEAREVGGGAKSAPIGPILPDTEVVMTAWRSINLQYAGTLICRVRYAGADQPDLLLSLLDSTPLGTFAMSSAGAHTEVSSLIVYTSPILCHQPVGVEAMCAGSAAAGPR